jgi:hypothetical protein
VLRPVQSTRDVRWGTAVRAGGLHARRRGVTGAIQNSEFGIWNSQRILNS